MIEPVCEGVRSSLELFDSVVSGIPISFAIPQSNNQGFAKVAEHDIGWLEVAVEHALLMRVGNRVAHIDKPVQQEPEFEARIIRRGPRVESRDGLPQRLSLDEAHRIEDAPIGMGPHSVNRNDARMFEPAGDPGFDQEPLSPEDVAAVLSSYLLECNLPLELRVFGDENLAKAPFRMRMDNPIPDGLDVVYRFTVGHLTRRMLTPDSVDMDSTLSRSLKLRTSGRVIQLILV